MSRRQPSFLPALRFLKRGFTILELLVAMLLLGVISTVLIGILTQSSALVSQGASLVSMHQKSRGAITRMAPYVATAVADGQNEAVLIPNMKSIDPTYFNKLRFTTTEDFLSPGYDPRATYDPSSPLWTYEFEFIRDNPLDPTSLGRIELHRIDDGAISTAVTPRVIAHKVQNFRCLLITSNTVEVTIDTAGERKGPQGNMIPLLETERACLSIPTRSY